MHGHMNVKLQCFSFQMQSKHMVSARLFHVFSFKNSLSVLFFCTKWRRSDKRVLPVTWFLALVSTNIQRGREIIEIRFTVKQNFNPFSHIGLFLESFSRSFPYHVSCTCKFSTLAANAVLFPTEFVFSYKFTFRVTCFVRILTGLHE